LGYGEVGGMTMAKREIKKLLKPLPLAAPQWPVIGPAHANCGQCELKVNCDRGKVVGSKAPRNWNGIMVIGEGPGRQEVVEGRPFVGASGRLLRAMFESEGVDLDDCYVTNATLCLPPPSAEAKGFHDRFPNAVYSCLPRLEAEIAAVKPRVIISFGAASMIALTGYEETTSKRKPFECDNCDNDRKVGPIIECSAKDALKKPCHKRYWADEVPADGMCGKCGASLKKAKPKRVKCPKCHGLKTKVQDETHFEYDYKISEIAGAVISHKQHAWTDLGVKYIIPTIHPAALLRDTSYGGGQFMAKAVQKHIRKAVHLSKVDEDWGFEYETTAGESDSEAAEHLREYIYDGTYATVVGTSKTRLAITDFSADIETEAWNADHTKELDATELTEVSQINCIGFASVKRGYAFVVDTRDMRPGSALARMMQRVLTDVNVKKCFHHGTYDVPVIRKLWGYDVAGYDNDTLIQHHVLYPDEPHRLAHLAFSFTYAPIWKPPKNLKGREAHESFESLVKYNARDTMLTDEIKEHLTASLTRHKMSHVYDLDMNKLQQQALSMQKSGMYVSKESALKVGKEALEKTNDALKKMRKIIGVEDFNPNAQKQLQWALFTKLGYNAIDRTSKGAASTAAASIKKLPDSPFRNALLSYSAANATLKGYFEVDDERILATPAKALHLWPDGRLRAVWKPFGTRTGRFSSNPNLQNWPKWMRALIVAPPGRKIVGADYDQLELRILAALSGDEMLIDKCSNADENDKLNPDCDPHSFVALNAFGLSYTGLNKKDPMHNKDDSRCRCETCARKAMRDLCKRVIYGLNYGAGDEKVLESIYEGGYEGPEITLQMIGRVRQAIFRAFKRVLPYQQKLIRESNANGYISDAILGRKRHFPLGDIPVTEIKNFVIQSTGASIINIRNTMAYENLASVDPSALYMAQVHDAVYYEVDEDKAEAFSEFLGEMLTWETSLYPGGPKMRFSASGAIADDWKSAA
jgi:uracil-DNA glycosylase family 4